MLCGIALRQFDLYTYNLISMEKTELYILIAVFLFLTIALVWMGARMWNDMRKRQQNQGQQRKKSH